MNYKVLTSSLRSAIEDKINDEAEKGYRIIKFDWISGSWICLMTNIENHGEIGYRG